MKVSSSPPGARGPQPAPTRGGDQCGFDPGPTTQGPVSPRLEPDGQRLGNGSERKQIPTSCGFPFASMYAPRPAPTFEQPARHLRVVEKRRVQVAERAVVQGSAGSRVLARREAGRPVATASGRQIESSMQGVRGNTPCATYSTSSAAGDPVVHEGSRLELVAQVCGIGEHLDVREAVGGRRHWPRCVHRGRAVVGRGRSSPE